MLKPRRSPAPSLLGSLALIIVIVGGGAPASPYTAGCVPPQRLTPDRVVDAFTPPGDKPPLGHRRNHAKGICFTGVFEANGAGSAISYASMFTRGTYPALGRFH